MNGEDAMVGFGQITESEATQRGLAGREVVTEDGRVLMADDATRLCWTPRALMAPVPLAPPWMGGLPVEQPAQL